MSKILIKRFFDIFFTEFTFSQERQSQTGKINPEDN